jgi:hypothetical protein
MSLRRLLPTLDNAGRRLVLAEVLGQPVSIRLKRQIAQRSTSSALPEDSKTPVEANLTLSSKGEGEPHE